MESGRIRVAHFARAVAWRRRLLAAGLAAGAVAMAIEAASSSAPVGTEIHVAARDLDGSTVIQPDHLITTTVPPEAHPDGVLDAKDAVGGVLAGPIRAGEPVTDRRLVGPSLLDGWGDDLVASPVRIADAGAAALIRVGDRINLLAVAADGAHGAHVVAADIPVLSVDRDSGDTSTGGTLLTVAATPEQAAELAQAEVTSRLSFTIGSAGHR
ncbi:RcpC/CpaB family pilus assembly protein [Phytoactinopolyspora endophytica]|uniref:RcpC/CpaB family pilus assembly protein n=1 Tax=Phytoactinopolyspora endophytica TaxID=1642495 RepID=UPI0013ED29C8|nr:RcpC/CpaB family pilus assembly protein [Phytoactinopolyspora endophytica]